MAHIMTFILSLSVVLISHFIFKEEYNYMSHSILTYLIYIYIKSEK